MSGRRGGDGAQERGGVGVEEERGGDSVQRRRGVVWSVHWFIGSLVVKEASNHHHPYLTLLPIAYLAVAWVRRQGGYTEARNGCGMLCIVVCSAL